MKEITNIHKGAHLKLFPAVKAYRQPGCSKSTFRYDLVDIGRNDDTLDFVQFEVLPGFSQAAAVPSFVLKCNSINL